ncbi:MAG: DUF533 domain-containing protein [Bernardetiaceae bacterium]|jgi:hypothetical protein|nr:DUF533 domain-containing protein [Bernardetiaceae bacterium]
MPVRIVKDNPDEMAMSEAFNFDNPNGQGGGGGGSGLGGLLDMLGGGGGGQSQAGGLGGLLSLLGGGGQQSQAGGLGGLLNMLGGGGQSQAGGLGGLLNMLGGGGQVQRGGAGNSLMSMLGSMAISACMNYAMRKFTGGGGGGGMFSQGAPTAQDAEQLLQQRFESARLCVSLWSYACGVDRQFADAEKDALQQLIQKTSSELFPQSVANQEEVHSEMIEAFNSPVEYRQIVEAARSDAEFAAELFGQACFLVAVDKNFSSGEQEFITQIGNDFGLEAGVVRGVRAQFGI